MTPEEYFRRLESLLGSALKGAINTGLLRGRSKARGEVAALFLPDFNERRLRLIACDPYNHLYKSAVGGEPGSYEFSVSLFYPHTFAERYNERVRELESRKRMGRLAEVRNFRKGIRDVASTAGILLEYQRIWPFTSLEAKCLTFDYSHAEKQVSHECRLLLTFQSMVGVPVTLAKRVVGALLFLSPRNEQFFSRDPLYWSISEEVGNYIGIGIASGVFDGPGLGKIFEEARPFKEQARVDAIKTFLNCFRPDFKKPIDLGKPGISEGDFYVWTSQ